MARIVGTTPGHPFLWVPQMVTAARDPSTMAVGLSIASLVVALIAAASAASSAASSKASAKAADRSAAEARRFRLDELGPQVSLGPPRGMRGRWHTPPGIGPGDLVHPPGLAVPGTEYSYPGNGEVRVLMGVWLPFRNEGSRTATLNIDGYRVDRCDDLTNVEAVLSPPAASPSPMIRGGTVSLAPGEAGGVIIRVGPTVAKWRERGDQPEQVTITASASPEGARQHWVLELNAKLLQQKRGDESHYTVLAHSPPTVPFTELPRTYPD